MEEPEIKNAESRKLLGHHITTSLAKDKTFILWNGFTKSRKEIKNSLNEDLFSVKVYDADFIKGNFNPKSLFEKWAATEVTNYDTLPKSFEKLELPGGLYAVFIHKGSENEFARTAQYIYKEWIPKSKYKLDNRPHFEILSDKYKGPNNSDNEEDIWVPIKEE